MEVVGWSKNYLTSFKNRETAKSVSLVRNEHGGINWRPPDLGRYKINFKSVIDGGGGRIGIGIVIRDSTGFVMASSSQFLDVVLDAQVAEEMAIYRGILFCRD
ncbi:hypothetical protein Dsin_021449 [Dipteronia sinensis]|uniref:RNase H type-1 domain-containing protein n=1 Tax=Dipteronia sinensis TaxID=43782 RepID=A0AAD9ZZT3_9ROSI|nr:hypothetical protein Dsin_021449 [Dipteronia sinensis]